MNSEDSRSGDAVCFNFDPGNFFANTVEEDIYRSLDLNVKDMPNSASTNSENEFDLEKIKKDALKHPDISACLEPSEQIDNFPEIDLHVSSEQDKQLSHKSLAIDYFDEKVRNTNRNLKVAAIDSKILESAAIPDYNDIESPDYEPMSPKKRSEDDSPGSTVATLSQIQITEAISKNQPFMESEEESNSESTLTVQKISEICSSTPSPFLSSFTPPDSPVPLSSRCFKREKSLEITDNFFESDYFEDDNLNNFQQEEVYTDEYQPIAETESEEPHVIDQIFADTSQEKNRRDEKVEEVVMNDHSYISQEQNYIISAESYIKHTNILKNSLNVFISGLKNCHLIPELIEKKDTLEEGFKEIFTKINVLKSSLELISGKAKEISKIEENKEKSDEFNFECNETSDIKCKADFYRNFDETISEALKKVEHINCDREKNIKHNEQTENNIETFHKAEDNSCVVESLSSQSLDSIHKTESIKEKVIFKDSDDEIVENVIENNHCTDFKKEKPLTKYEALVELANTILKFSSTPQVKPEKIEEFFENTKDEFKSILIRPHLSTSTVQTDHSGKIYSERRLKSINEKEKKRLLNDFSDSSEISSEYESETDFDSNNDFQNDTNLNKEEQENILNGIDFSKYLDSSNEDSDNFPNDFSEHLDVILEEVDENTPQTLNGENLEKPNGNIYAISNGEKNENDNNTKESATNGNGIKKTSDSVDKEIDRLLDFKGLASKKIHHSYRTANSEKKQSVKKISVPDISEILAEEENKESSDGTDSEEEDCVANEKLFLIKQNENLKKQLLESSSSSDTENDCDISLPEDIEDDEDEEGFDENKPTLVEKFLKSYVEVDDDLEKSTEKKLNGEHFSKLDGIIEKDTNNHNVIESEKESNEKSPNENGLENKENDMPDNEDSDKQNISSDCEILDKTFSTLKQTNKKRKSLDTLLVEDQKRRKNLKISDEIFSLSSEEESDVEVSKTKKTEPHRLIRPIMKNEQLTSETKKAQKEEQGRLNRLKKKENILKKAYKEHSRDPSDIRELILDYNTTTKKFITVNNDLVCNLKQHQIDGVKFMYDCCYGSINFINDFPGSGCILAHCMGLGKTLQLITLINTLISHKDLNTSRILILCPKSTVMNWAEEIQRWLGPLGVKSLKVFTFNDVCDISDKMNVLEEWHSCGSFGSHSSGCLLIGYEAFRTLVSYPNKKNRNLKLDLEEIKTIIKKTLLDPGADLVVCDEGHIIKNRRAAISQAVTEIRTPRRIVLTGTPIQNNLKEYYSMVNFIKPSYLGTEKEFANVYANPIKNGQHKDSSKRDIKIMKQRSFVLHSKLSSFVQRREAALLKTFLPQKFEYVLFIPMTSVQVRLYEIFLEAVRNRKETDKKDRNLLTDYTCLRKIWTHPKVLENAYNNAMMLKNKREKKINSLELPSDEDQPDDIYDSQTGFMSVTSDWWRQHITEQDLKSILPSNKLQTMFEILRMCSEKEEKCLIFSAFVAVLNVVEIFMNLINENNSETSKEYGIDRFTGPWVNGKDYYRLDGKTPKTLRHEMVKSFNDPANTRAKVFLISAKAGGQGINLIGANRVIILDTSWNPSNDQQNIFRIFRLGQKRNCYIYRLLSSGTMEEKVYSRSVTKQAMSFRVMDEHQIDRHYNMADLAELYTLTKPDYSNRPIPNLPQDNILAHLLRNFPHYVYKYHEHDSLLENKIEQELSEQEKEDAWLAYENEINSVANSGFPNFSNLEMFGGPHLPGAMPPLDNFPQRSPSSSDIYNQGRNPLTSSPFFPSYGFPNKAYLDNMFSYFSNTNPLYGGLDIPKSPAYGEPIGSNFLLPNNRPPGNGGLGLTNPPASSPSFSPLDPLHIPATHANTFGTNLPSYSSLYSNPLLNNSLNRFSNTSLENFKNLFENYVKAPSTGLYAPNQNKMQASNDLRITKTTDKNLGSKHELSPFRKHNLHPNFSASLASTSSGSMTNSILSAQNRLINQSTGNDLTTSAKKNSTGSTNSQKDNRVAQNFGSVQFKQSSNNISNPNTFASHSSKVTNHQVRQPKISSSDLEKTDTLRNAAFGILKRDSSNQNQASSFKTSAGDSNDKIGIKSKQMMTQNMNLMKNLTNQNLMSQSSSSKNNSNMSKTISNIRSTNSQQLSSNAATAKNAHRNQILKGRTTSPSFMDALLRKNADLSNLSKSKTNNSSLVFGGKPAPSLELQKVSNSGSISKMNKILMDPLSPNVEDKLISAGISISKKSVNTKAVIGSGITNSKQTNHTISNQAQTSIMQRKRTPNHENNNNNRTSTGATNRLSDQLAKKAKLTPKELAEELSSSLRRIQSSQGLTIVHKGGNKTASSGDVLEVD